MHLIEVLNNRSQLAMQTAFTFSSSLLENAILVSLSEIEYVSVCP